MYVINEERGFTPVKKNEHLCSCFSESGIEYWAALPLDELKIKKKYLIDRLDFVPTCAIIFLVPYYVGDAENLSEYAAARDYHNFISLVGGRVCDTLKEKLGANGAFFGDHSPIDERDAAARSALGIIGDNGLLINEKYGTYVFTGEVLTDLSPESIPCSEAVLTEFCEHCGECMRACPISEIGECLSALTQKKGELTDKERQYIKKYGSAWGCDMCQSACPHNRHPKCTPIEYFREKRISRITSELVKDMSDAEFSERAFAWRGKDVILRNLEIFEKR